MTTPRFNIATATFVVGAVCLLPAFSDASQPVELGEGIAISLEMRQDQQPRDDAPPTSPRLTAAAYEVDVYGGMAIGTLIQEFANDSENDLEARYRLSSGGDVRFKRLELELSGHVRDLRADLESDPATKEQVSRRRLERLADGIRRGTVPSDELSKLSRAERLTLGKMLEAPPAGGKLDAAERLHLKSDPFDVGAEEPLTLRSSFTTTLPIEGRVFRLKLPALSLSESRPVKRATDETLPLRIQVTIHHADELPLVDSDTHSILVDFVGNRTIVETVERTVPADRPFELRFAVSSQKQPTLAGYVREEKDGRRAVEALVTPPEKPTEKSTRPKELLFIVDSSGSMAHERKLEQARRAVASSIRKLRPVDRFNIVEFDDQFRMMSEKPVELESYGRDRVKQWLSQLQPGGGTTLLPALAAMLEQPADPERHRMIVVVTDGILQDEEEALNLLREKLGEGRLFVVGTGPRMRQETLLRLAEYGRGAAAFAGQPSELEAAVAELFDRFSRPLGWDLKFDWAGAEIDEVTPARLPDLYAGRAVRVVAWVRGDLPSVLRVRMSTMEGEQLYDVSLPPIDTRLATR